MLCEGGYDRAPKGAAWLGRYFEHSVRRRTRKPALQLQIPDLQEARRCQRERADLLG